MGKGGFRYGAGRHGWRRKCEHMLALDIRMLVRSGVMVTLREFHIDWLRNGAAAGSIRGKVQQGCVSLNDGTGQTQVLTLDHTACHYGNTRSWFLCPDCQRRCAVVYAVSVKRFTCRACLGLAYSSEAEATMTRLWRQRDKVGARLADGKRPPRMHHRTFELYCMKIRKIDQRIAHHVTEDLSWLRYDFPMNVTSNSNTILMK